MMDPKDLPFPPEVFPFATNEQLRANDAYRDSLLSPELYEEKQRQLRELCQLLKEAGERARASRPPPGTLATDT